MKFNFSPILVALFLFFYLSCSVQNENIEREILFNDGWQFTRTDVSGAENPDFDDSHWRTLDLPHDYSIEDLPEKEGIKQIGPFSEESQGKASTGHVLGGTAWYRKHFVLGKEDEGKIVKILFDGIYMNADVWINGHHLGNQPFGYTAFYYGLTPCLNPAGEKNVLAVQVKNEGENSRWYSGSGIYRDVKLIKTDPLHVKPRGTFITTPKVSKDKATVNAEIRIANDSHLDKSFDLMVKILNQEGSEVKAFHEISSQKIEASETIIIQTETDIEKPDLWSPENPALYTATIQLLKNGKVFDEVHQTFGIRSIEFSAEKGFLLNGKSVLLKGGCVHHDNGILGSAAFKAAEYRKVKTMKENGFNAIRCAHNPPSQLFLNACDELGVLVMDESFDQWQLAKKPKDYNLYFDDWWERDLESMLLRDRNHPSIIIWSVGNEIKERASEKGLEIFTKLKSKVKELDTTRPVTQAVCSFWEQPGKPWEDTEPVFAQLDVHSYNYQWQQYENDHAKFPERIIVGTESFPMEAFENWQMAKKHSYVIGDFVWTGMDYLGESGIGSSKLDNEDISFLPPWPWYNAYCGDISVLGYKKPQMFYRDVVWGNSKLEMLVHKPIPEGRKEIISNWGWPEEWKNWNWEGSEGKPVRVNVYSSCEEVKLELNGKVIGKKAVSEETKLTATFETNYEPGELVAIGFTNGKEVTRQTLKTAGNPDKLKITAEKSSVAACSRELAYFNVEVLDENGILVPNAEIPVEFNIQGKCKLQAVGNGNPVDMKSFQQPKVNTFRGKCQLIVRSNKDAAESVIKVSAKSEGLNTGTAVVKVNSI
jgi:beta-galactosidase